LKSEMCNYRTLNLKNRFVMAAKTNKKGAKCGEKSQENNKNK